MRVKYLPVAEGRRLHIEAFPNFSASGSIKGMKDKFYGKNALLVKCGSVGLLKKEKISVEMKLGLDDNHKYKYNKDGSYPK